MQRMGVAPGRRYEDVVSPSNAAAFGTEGKSASKNSAKVGLGNLLLVPAASFEVRAFVCALVSSRACVHLTFLRRSWDWSKAEGACTCPNRLLNSYAAAAARKF